MFRIKHELDFIVKNIALIALSAFLCAMGGIILWISGGSTWYLLRLGENGKNALSLALVFVIWFLVYGLCGALIALFGLFSRNSCRGGSVNSKNGFTSFCLILGAYLLMLLWYVTFFCTRLVILPAILLVISVAVLGITLFISRKTFFLISVIIILIELVHIYYIYFTLSIYF